MGSRMLSWKILCFHGIKLLVLHDQIASACIQNVMNEYKVIFVE